MHKQLHIASVMLISTPNQSAVSSPAAVVPVATSIMKIKKTDSEGPEPASEAEALRKDPLKNYTQESLGLALQEE